ncbi:MAG: hypothetical protein WCP39_04035 [Chlamydiota bacterium]
MKKLSFLYLCFSLLAFGDESPVQIPAISQEAKELSIDLKNPVYQNGLLQTTEGGVIKNEDIRIQAEKISYGKKVENGKTIHLIQAEDNLLIRYKDRIFVGQKLVYDFTNKTGVIYEGRTFTSPWYIGGDEVHLQSDGGYSITNVFITSCENKDSSWDIRANAINVSKNNKTIEAQKVRYRFFNLPSIWLPSFRVNLKKFMSTPLFRITPSWDKKGPKISVRYQVFSLQDFALFARADYRFKRGFGGAIETEYYSPKKQTTFETKSYLATDTLPNDPKNKRRYRLQGAYHTTSPSGDTKADLTWDKYSDSHMPGDFKTSDFEISTAKQTQLFVRHEEENFLTLIQAHARVNPFETLKQDLPTVYVTLRPLDLPVLGIISHSEAKTSYLSYTYSDELKNQLSDYSAIRLETNNEISRPIYFPYLTVTPTIGASGILYSKGPHQKKPKTLGSFFYGCHAETRISKSFSEIRHIILPYLQYEGWTRPTLTENHHYIFSIQDGYHKINILEGGIKNQFFDIGSAKKIPTFEIDLYANSFFTNKKFAKTIPKLYMDLYWNLSILSLYTKNCWNIENNLLDFSNTGLGWTLSDNLALGCEFRHRSRFDWRKSDHRNFILDVSRTDEELVDSPLSDRRNTVITKAFFRPHPFWACMIESHHGWNRPHEPAYNEWKIDLYTTLSSSWKLQLSYQHTQTEDKVSASYILIGSKKESTRKLFTKELR